MRLSWKFFFVGIVLCLLGFIVSNGHATSLRAQDLSVQSYEIEGPSVSEVVMPAISKPVRTLSAVKPSAAPLGIYEINSPQSGDFTPVPRKEEDLIIDPLRKMSSERELLQIQELFNTPAPSLHFEGINNLRGVVPPDPIGDVGPNHYVQMVNTFFAIYDKSGTLLTGPSFISQLWAGQGNACEFLDNGDPVVLYDNLADRWLISQFALPSGIQNPPWHMCIAISQTPDPTGSYFLYQFDMPTSPDYPKFAVWPDAYYMSANEFLNFPSIGGAYAFDRASMLAGNPATFIRFSAPGNFLLPGDLDGATTPPSNSPNYFYRMMDDVFWSAQGFPGPDRLEIFEFDADFANPLNSTFTLSATLPTPFNYTVCGWFVRDCIPQPFPGEGLDSLSSWPMWRLQYRNFGSYQTLVGNFTVDVDGTQLAGIRWFELRKTAGSNWAIHQQGTYSPDRNHRWMGSIAMDRDGNIALGYSVSGFSSNPSIRYATRLETDPLGTLQNEVTLIAGGGVQAAGFNRWGDYSSMNVDPVDDCTFWYTNEYYGSTSSAGWQTRIGKFKIPSCGEDGQVTMTSPVVTGDLNDDGNADIAGIDTSGKVWYTTDLSTWTDIPGRTLAKIATGDVNGDGNDDIVGVDASGSIWYTANLSTWISIKGKLADLVTGNFDGDGDDDIAGVNATGKVWYTNNLGNTWTQIPGRILAKIATGDLNGDSNLDIVGVDGSGKISYTTNLTSWVSIPGILVKIVTGDLDGDGDDDIVGLNSLGKLWYTTNLSSWTNIRGILKEIVTGNFDGDGDDDIAGVNAIGRVWYTTNLGSTWTQISGQTLETIATGDLNGNGNDDIAGVDAPGKVWYSINLSTWINIPLP